MWTWYRAYCAAMVLVLLAVFVGGLMMLAVPERMAEGDPKEAEEAQIAGLVYLVVSLPLLAAYASAPFLPRTPSTWTYHLVLICVGMLCGCGLPASIPLLIFWIQPACQSFFGRGGTSRASGWS